MLAVLLAENISPETLHVMLASFLNILPGPGQAAAAPVAEPPLVSDQSSSSVSARNLAGSLPE